MRLYVKYRNVILTSLNKRLEQQVHISEIYMDKFVELLCLFFTLGQFQITAGCPFSVRVESFFASTVSQKN